MRMPAFAVVITIPMLLRSEFSPESPASPLRVAEIVGQMDERDQAYLGFPDPLHGQTGPIGKKGPLSNL